MRPGLLRVDDELEGIELLVLRPKPVQGLATTQVRQSTAHRVGQETKSTSFSARASSPCSIKAPWGSDDGLFVPPGQEIQGTRPLPRGHHLDPLAVRLPVARPLVVDALNERFSHLYWSRRPAPSGIGN